MENCFDENCDWLSSTSWVLTACIKQHQNQNKTTELPQAKSPNNFFEKNCQGHIIWGEKHFYCALIFICKKYLHWNYQQWTFRFFWNLDLYCRCVSIIKSADCATLSILTWPYSLVQNHVRFHEIFSLALICPWVSLRSRHISRYSTVHF